jgi:WD40 repeat protein
MSDQKNADLMTAAAAGTAITSGQQRTAEALRVAAIAAQATADHLRGTAEAVNTVAMNLQQTTEAQGGAQNPAPIGTSTPTSSATVMPADTPSPASAYGGLSLLFVQAEAGGTYGIYALQSIGGIPESIITGLPEQLGPLAVSPNGRRAAFAAQVQNTNKWELHFLDLERVVSSSIPGSQVKYLRLWPAWRSADGQELTFFSASLPGGVLGTWQVGDEKQDELPIDLRTEQIQDPDWSRDGTHLAFVIKNGQSGSLWTWDVQSTNDPIAVDGQASSYGHPRWSPDGNQLAAECNFADGNRGICILDIQTGVERVLRKYPLRPSWRPVWSPDGKWIAFVSDYVKSSGNFQGMSGEVFLMSVEDGTLTRVTFTAGCVYAWGLDWPLEPLQK